MNAVEEFEENHGQHYATKVTHGPPGSIGAEADQSTRLLDRVGRMSGGPRDLAALLNEALGMTSLAPFLGSERRLFKSRLKSLEGLGLKETSRCQGPSM